MTTLADTIDAMMASSSATDIGSQHRLQFWQEQLGDMALTDTPLKTWTMPSTSSSPVDGYAPGAV